MEEFAKTGDKIKYNGLIPGNIGFSTRRDIKKFLKNGNTYIVHNTNLNWYDITGNNWYGVIIGNSCNVRWFPCECFDEDYRYNTAKKYNLK